MKTTLLMFVCALSFFAALSAQANPVQIGPQETGDCPLARLAAAPEEVDGSISDPSSGTSQEAEGR